MNKAKMESFKVKIEKFNKEDGLYFYAVAQNLEHPNTFSKAEVMERLYKAYSAARKIVSNLDIYIQIQGVGQ